MHLTKVEDVASLCAQDELGIVLRYILFANLLSMYLSSHVGNFVQDERVASWQILLLAFFSDV